MFSKSYFLKLTSDFSLRPDHHNVRDLIDMCELNECRKEASFLRRKLANSGEFTSSVFINPFLDMCFPKAEAKREEVLKDAGMDPIPIRPGESSRTALKPLEVLCYSSGEIVEVNLLEAYARFKCAKCGKTTRVQLVDGIGCVYCVKGSKALVEEFKSERERLQGLADHITKERPGLVPVFTRKSDTEAMREACDDEYAHLPPENASPPVKFHPPRKVREWTIRELQDSHREWVEHNFPEQLTDPTRADDGFDGLVEEVGELARARLKARQGIRGTPEFWRDQQLDAVGDIVIFLISWCTAHDIDLQSTVEKTWAEVSKRDWKKYPETGVPPVIHIAGDSVKTDLGQGTLISMEQDIYSGQLEYLIKITKFPSKKREKELFEMRVEAEAEGRAH